MTAAAYDNWKKRLEVANLPTVAARRAELTRLGLNNMEPTMMDAGYYRIPLTEKHPTNGKNVILGYDPVALWSEGGVVVGVRGQHEMSPEQIVDSWTWMCGHPISYELYQAVAERGEPWPDLAVESVVFRDEKTETEYRVAHDEDGQRTMRVIERDDNKPPEVLPEVEAAESIDNAIGAARDLPVTTAAEAAIAAGAANVIRDRRLAVEKTAKAKVTPLQMIYEEERNKWLPLVKRAKEAEGAIRVKVAEFEAAERRRVAAEQLAAIKKQEEIDEAAARAADRAIAAGQPEQPPVVEEVEIPKVPERVQPTYGSYKPRQTEKWHFDGVEDFDALYAALKDSPELKSALTVLAKAMVTAGRDVPGVKRHWGVI